MPEEVFIDASFWMAVVYRREQRNQRAREYWELTVRNGWRRVTANWTLYEAMTLLNGHGGRHDLALGLLELARRTTTIADAAEYEIEAPNVFTSHADKRWSVVDCANFVCIRERTSGWALSFDSDFAQAQNEFGFTLLSEIS